MYDGTLYTMWSGAAGEDNRGHPELIDEAAKIKVEVEPIGTTDIFLDNNVMEIGASVCFPSPD